VLKKSARGCSGRSLKLRWSGGSAFSCGGGGGGGGGGSAFLPPSDNDQSDIIANLEDEKGHLLMQLEGMISELQAEMPVRPGLVVDGGEGGIELKIQCVLESIQSGRTELAQLKKEYSVLKAKAATHKDYLKVRRQAFYLLLLLCLC
jgi:hypothetical protein